MDDLNLRMAEKYLAPIKTIDREELKSLYADLVVHGDQTVKMEWDKDKKLIKMERIPRKDIFKLPSGEIVINHVVANPFKGFAIESGIALAFGLLGFLIGFAFAVYAVTIPLGQ